MAIRLWWGKLLKSMIRRFQSGDYKALIMSSLTTRPNGFDRIMRDDENQIIGILKDELCDDDFCGLSEVTAGVYCFDTALLLSTMGKIWSYQSIEGGEDENLSVPFLLLILSSNLVGRGIS